MNYRDPTCRACTIHTSGDCGLHGSSGYTIGAEPIQTIIKETPINFVLRMAQELRPDLWARTEAVARIIDPAAFMDGWIVEPPERAAILTIKLRLQQATAMSKAQAILAYLGVNTEHDGTHILERLAQEWLSP